MLSEVVLAYYAGIIDRPHAGGALTVTGISPCPYATYINYHSLDRQDFSSLDRLRMKNGHWQEREVLEDLRRAGFKMRYTGSDQLVLNVGRVPITGRPDGLITVSNREDVLSIKAMNSSRFIRLRKEGLASEPSIECQEQLYLASEEFRNSMAGTWIYAKHKDSCKPYDFFLEKDLGYSKPIVEATEEIILSGTEVKRPKDPLPLCSSCRHKSYCWVDPVLDMSKVKVVDLPEAVAKWKEGKSHQTYGEILEEEARETFELALAEDRLMLAEDLRIQKVSPASKLSFSERKFAGLFGSSRLPEVMVEKKRQPYIRIEEV